MVKNFVGFTALGRLSMSVKRGRILAVIGPNGAGKSTLLRMLCDLSQPSLGEVALEVLDRNLKANPKYWSFQSK
ncbi:MAG TPA: ATP-binding cassette domain-containing protein [Verrucomicrobiales bacterium]|nr:ATP-binding cassette domain-containing protein [Verrucomicrobiales bacterium]HIL68513.1 ATP-binding cassette domain-containing protein [Verrucomicrobiota bacterium]